MKGDKIEIEDKKKDFVVPSKTNQLGNQSFFTFNGRNWSVFEANGSQHLEIGDPENRIEHNLSTRIVLKYYYNTAFGDPKQSACDPKVGRDPIVEKHCFRLCIRTPLTHAYTCL